MVAILFIHFPAPPQILAASAIFCQFQKIEEMIVMVSFGALRRFALIVTFVEHPVINVLRAVASSIFFMVLSLMLFEVRRIVCVEN